MPNKVDFFQKKLSYTRSFSRQRQKVSYMWIWVILVLILVFSWSFVIWKVFWAPTNLEWIERDLDVNFSLWNEVFLQWEIKADWDIITHTHTINDLDYWIIWIKSDLVNLSNYAGFVQLTWLVEKFYQWNPIVKVISLSWTMVWINEDETNIVLDENSGVYILWAWIQFLPSFFDEYVLLNEWENGEIRIQNIETWKEIVLNYFRCSVSDPNKNCRWLAETFANNSAQSFVTSEGDVFYKQSEVQSWFVANWDWWGVFINDVSDDVVFELKDLIKFANQRNINEWVRSRAMKLCQWNGEKMQKINSTEVALKQEWLIVTVSGDWREKQMSCQLLVDFSLPTKWKLISLSLWDNVVVTSEEQEDENNKLVEAEINESEQEVNNWQISAMPFDLNVPQFPIKETWLIYKSSRWGYSLQFPSSNISYSVSSVKEDFWRNDVSCSYVINVIKYSDKENLEVSPSVRIYECQWAVEKSWANDIIVYPRMDKKFVVKMNDGAWNDFSMNLKFEELSDE